MKLFLNILIATLLLPGQVLLPVRSDNRHDFSTIQLTEIGKYGVVRKAREKVPEHYHTGIDIKRPGNNYIDEPVYPIARGVVISKRIDGPYANIIIEHEINGCMFWTLYEHVAGITVGIRDIVDPEKPIARFMNKEELNRYGWQFDHFHFEVIKVRPLAQKSDRTNEGRFFNSYSLMCFTPDDLNRYYFNPVEFLKSNL
ncbi:MAG TPA: M23 family metallopeptidase [Bacteroidales bacterium]|nr:M23 family metallopeptidase [Bacteroidales bacterium]